MVSMLRLEVPVVQGSYKASKKVLEPLPDPALMRKHRPKYWPTPKTRGKNFGGVPIDSL